MTVSTAAKGELEHPEVRPQPLRICAMTMARDEAGMLPRWLRYYGRQLGAANLFVLDDNSSDGSTRCLDASVVRLPSGPWRGGTWTHVRHVLANTFARGLFQIYDVVLFADVDEFLLPDPARYDGLVDYVSRCEDQVVMAGVGLNVLHDAAHEASIDPDKPVLQQRSLVKFAPVMCKPAIKREPVDWMPGTHGIRSPFSVDPDLLLLHLKFHDEGQLRRVAEHRHAAYSENRGGKDSAWRQNGQALATRMARWVDGGPVGLLDTRRLPLPEPEPARANGFFRMVGSQLEAMDESPLLRLPARYLTDAF